MLAVRAPGRTTETIRVPDEVTVHRFVADLEPGVTWKLYEREYTHWRLRDTGTSTSARVRSVSH
jgi:hypothetical protein